MSALNTAREAFYAKPTHLSAGDYIRHTLEHYTERFEADLDDDFYLYRAAGEVGFWLLYNRIERMPHPKHPE